MGTRRRLNGVRLTEEAHTGLDALATRGRVTKNSMLEALGRLGRRDDVDWDDVIAEALRIDRENLSRR
jgi:hypothetical protein